MKWSFLGCDHNVTRNFCEKFNISEITAKILNQRGFDNVELVDEFINPKISNLQDPFILSNMREAVDLVEKHLQQNSTIAIIGDYDVDGITSTALLVEILRKFHANVYYFIPRRFTEGYGMSTEIVTRVLQNCMPNLVIAVDCGTNSNEQIQFLINKKIDVLIIDHHTLTLDCVPKNAIILNPHLPDITTNKSLQSMCAVGLVFKFAHAFLKFRRLRSDKQAFEIKLKNYLDIVAMGTIADMMPMRLENRILVKYGLNLFAKNRRPGLDALCCVCNLPPNHAITQPDVSFKLAPRINVSGRLSDASLPVELLLSTNCYHAMSIAKQLDSMNKERQRIEFDITQEAAVIVKEKYANSRGIVLYNASWHSGVVGIVAGKLSRDYGRPTIVLALERGLAKGSGRSVSYNLVDILSECSDYVEAWGGHKMAIGISILPEKVDEFRTAFECAIERYSCEHKTVEEEIEIASIIEKRDITEHLVNELEACIQPYGQNNCEPIFCLCHVQFANCSEFFGQNKKHFRFWIEREELPWITGIAWNMRDNYPEAGRDIDILITLNFDSWNNERFIMAKLIDWKYSL